MVIPWRRRLPPSSTAAFLVAGACAAAAFWAVDAVPAGDADLGPATAVVVAAVELAAGEPLVDDDLEIRELPSSAIPPGALMAPGDAVGRTSLTPFVPGEVVTASRLARSGGPLTASVPPGLVAITLTPDAAPAGIRPGDRVDVVATYLTARPYAATVGEDLAVLQVAGDEIGTSSPPLTLVTDPFTASELARADATATLAIAVRGFDPLLP